MCVCVRANLPAQGSDTEQVVIETETFLILYVYSVCVRYDNFLEKDTFIKEK